MLAHNYESCYNGLYFVTEINTCVINDVVLIYYPL